MASIPDDSSWSIYQKGYAKLVRTNPQEAFTKFCSAYSAPPRSTNSSPITLSGDALAQLQVIHFFLDHGNTTSGYESALHLVGSPVWEACLRTDLLSVLVDLVAGIDFLIPSIWTPQSAYAIAALSGFAHIWWFDIESSATPGGSVPSIHSITQLIRQSARMWDHVWRHKERLIESSRHGDDNFQKYGGIVMLRDIGETIVLVSLKRMHGMPAEVKSSQLPAYLIWSWWFLSPETGYQSDNRTLDAFVHVHMSSTLSEKRVWMEDIIINDIGAEQVLSKLTRSIMENEGLVGDILGNSLLALDEIASWKHPAMARAVARLPITFTLAHALKNKDTTARPYRVFEQADSSLAHLRFKIWISCAHLLETIALGVANGTTGPEMVSGNDVYSIFAHGLILASDTLRVDGKNVFASYKGFYSSSLQCWTNHLRRHKSDKDAFPTAIVKSLREAASPEWYGILLELRKITSAPEYTPRLVDDWLAFGTALGFDEEKKRKEYNTMLSHICSWPLCRYHLSPAKEIFKHCKGCGVAHYCSSECQLSDWKKGGHKVACRRIKK